MSSIDVNATPPMKDQSRQDSCSATKNNSAGHFDKRARVLLSQYTSLFFRQLYGDRPDPSDLKNLRAKAEENWPKFTELGKSLVDLTLSESGINNLFLSDGLCAAMCVHYLSQFFQSKNSLASSEMPIIPIPRTTEKSEISFFSLDVTEETLEAQTKHFRFLQAAYKVSTSLSAEYFPDQLLRKEKIELNRRLPAIDESGKQSYCITKLLPELKKLTGQPEKGFIIGISSPEKNHMIALHLDKPYHFFDPRYGIAMADKEEDLLLFLANHLTEKYPEYDGFALLEFAPS